VKSNEPAPTTQHQASSAIIIPITHHFGSSCPPSKARQGKAIQLRLHFTQQSTRYKDTKIQRYDMQEVMYIIYIPIHTYIHTYIHIYLVSALTHRGVVAPSSSSS